MATVLRATLAHLYRSTSVYVLVCVREGAVWKRNPSLWADPCFGSQLACSPAAQLSGQVASCRGTRGMAALQP